MCENNKKGASCCSCRPEVREVAGILNALPRDDFEHLAARIRAAQAMREGGSILAKILKAKPAKHPGYAAFEERLREVSDRMRGGD